LWIINIHRTYKCHLGVFQPKVELYYSLLLLAGNHILLIGNDSPPLLANMGLSGFIRYLHSFWHFPCRMERLCNTFIICWQFVCNIMQINNSMNSMFVHLLCEIMILSRASSTNSSEFNIHNMRQTIGSIYLVHDPELEMLYAFQKFSRY
jgi:hypothetical protein